MHLWWLLRPYWEVVTCDHILSVVCTQICPWPHWRTAYTSCKYKQKTVSDFHSIHCNANCCGIAVSYSVSKRASYLPTFSSSEDTFSTDFTICNKFMKEDNSNECRFLLCCLWYPNARIKIHAFLWVRWNFMKRCVRQILNHSCLLVNSENNTSVTHMLIYWWWPATY